MALELARCRVPVRLVDQMTERAYTSRAVASWPRALELLERAGDGVSAGPVAPGNKVTVISPSQWRMANGSPSPAISTFPSRRHRAA